MKVTIVRQGAIEVVEGFEQLKAPLMRLFRLNTSVFYGAEIETCIDREHFGAVMLHLQDEDEWNEHRDGTLLRFDDELVDWSAVVVPNGRHELYVTAWRDPDHPIEELEIVR